MLLKNVEEFLAILRQSKVRYCIIGGVAILLHGGRASTIDFDLYVLVTGTEAFRKALSKTGASLVISGPEQIRVKFKGLSIDVMIADPLLGAGTVERAQLKALGKMRVRVASPEDLIIMKTLADRPIDRRDVEELREIFAGKLDQRFISAQLRKIHKALAD